MNQQEVELLQRKVIGLYREAVRLYDEDREEATYLYHCAYNMNGEWMSDEFVALTHELQKIMRGFTPSKKGRYKTIHVSLGYSSIPVQQWVDDKVQPPRQTVDEALSRFDNVVAPWVESIVEKLEV